MLDHYFLFGCSAMLSTRILLNAITRRALSHRALRFGVLCSLGGYVAQRRLARSIYTSEFLDATRQLAAVNGAAGDAAAGFPERVKLYYRRYGV